MEGAGAIEALGSYTDGFGLDQANRAHEALESRSMRGKVLLAG